MAVQKLRHHQVTILLSAALLFLVAGPLQFWHVSGASLGARSLQLSDNNPGAMASYALTFAGQSAGTVGSIRAQFCSNDPLIGTSCTAPNGFDLSGATLTAQSGMTGFSIDGTNTTANVLVLTRAPGASVPGDASYTLTGVINPSTAGSFFVRVETFASTDASGSSTDYGGLALTTGAPISVSATVPPFLLLCTGTSIQPYDCSTATGDYINFGDFTPLSTKTGQTQALLATNAANGYTLSALGTTLTSGNNTIAQMSANDVSRLGVSQFGLNLRANTTPLTGQNPQGPGLGSASPDYDTPDFYRFNSGEVIASSTVPEDYRLYTVTYIVNVSSSQSPGIYVTTLTYIALANF